MRISEFLEPNAIVDDLAGSTAVEVLTQIARPLAARTGVETERLVAALLAREQLGSTGVGEGLAIPHARLAGVDRLVAGFGRARTGIDFKAQDGLPTTLFFVLFAPERGPGIHLNALARISRMFRSPEFRGSILHAGSAEEILRMIIVEDAK